MLHKAAFKTIPINTLYKLKVVNAVKHCQCNIFPSSAQKGRINHNVFFYLNWGSALFFKLSPVSMKSTLQSTPFVF